MSPYKERISFQYGPGGDLGQPMGGRTKYSSSGGSWDCTKACFTSQFFKVHLWKIANDVKNHSSSWDITGAVVNSFDQL